MDYNVILKQSAKRYGNKAAKIFHDRDMQLTYGDIAQHSLRVAHWLRSQGLRKGDVFAIWMGNVPEYIILMAASLRLGTVLIPINIYESVENVLDIYRECSCRLLFLDSLNKYIGRQLSSGPIAPEISYLDLAQQGAPDSIRLNFSADTPFHEEICCELAEDDDILITYTSGSTGKHKGIRRCIHNFFGKNGFSGLYRFALNTVNAVYPVRLFNLCPWYHNTGTYLLMITLSGGYFLEITAERYIPSQALEGVKKYKPNVWLGTATMLYRCCMTSDETSITLPIFIISTGEELPRHIVDKLESYPGTGILFSGYGTTEAGHIAKILYGFRKRTIAIRLLMLGVRAVGIAEKTYYFDDFPKDSRGAFLGDISRNVDVLIYDDRKCCALPEGEIGEICVCTPTAMKGYIGESEAEAYVHRQNRIYLRTGDLGFRRGSCLYLAGRKKNMIIRSGENILPGAIEKIAQEFPGVQAAVACGVPSVAYGEDLCLCLEAEQDKLNLEALQAALQSRLPKYMYPQYFLFWDTFPVNASGKTDVRRVQEEAIARIN